jgi:hypothetical protein
LKFQKNRCDVKSGRAGPPATAKVSLQHHASADEGRSMMAADSRTWVAFIEGDTGEDVELLEQAPAGYSCRERCGVNYSAIPNCPRALKRFGWACRRASLILVLAARGRIAGSYWPKAEGPVWAML